jgi:hypothetical protein
VRESLRAGRSEGYSCDRLGLIQLATRVRFDRGNSTWQRAFKGENEHAYPINPDCVVRNGSVCNPFST